MGEGDGAPPPFLHPVKDIQQQIIVIPRAETPLKPAIGIVRRRRHPLRRIGRGRAVFDPGDPLQQPEGGAGVVCGGTGLLRQGKRLLPIQNRRSSLPFP